MAKETPTVSDIKLVLTDVDGTIAQQSAHTISDAVRESVIAVQAQGIKVIPVTGRPLEMAQEVFMLLGFDGLCVVDNGASIREITTGKLIWSEWFDASKITEILDIVLPKALEADYTPGFDQHKVTDEERAGTVAAVDAPYVFVVLDKSDIGSITEQLDAVSGINYHIGIRPDSSSLVGLQVNAERATKFHGVEALRHSIGIAKEHTLAIGDGDNDIPLFQNAGIKIAMGNATESLKNSADYVVDTVDNDGFVEAMEKYIFGKDD